MRQVPVSASGSSVVPFASTSPPAPALIIWAIAYTAVAWAAGAWLFNHRDL